MPARIIAKCRPIIAYAQSTESNKWSHPSHRQTDSTILILLTAELLQRSFKNNTKTSLDTLELKQFWINWRSNVIDLRKHAKM